jgi:1-deoxy-D-xylulose-5-phosphate synthase
LDKKCLHEIFKKYDYIITIEDGCLNGGFGSAIIEFMVDNNYKKHVSRLGIPDQFIEHGPQKQLHKDCGYYKSSLSEKIESIKKNLNTKII